MNAGAIIRSCRGTGNGGGVSLLGSMTMNGGEITGCSIQYNLGGYGGGVWVNYGVFTMNGGSITNNRTLSPGGDGGGVFISNGEQYDGIFRMNGGTISGNHADNAGGGVFIHNGGASTVNLVEINNSSLITNNTATARGGGIATGANANVVLNNGAISDNSSALGGGVSVAGGSTFTMISGNISDNSSSGNGGGVRVADSCTFTMSGGTISTNSASSDGGGVHVAETGTFIITGNASPAPRIISNIAGRNGGGIYTYDYADLQIASNAVFGRAGTSTQNSAATQSDYYTMQTAYIAVAQTPFTPPVGVYSQWGQFYSTTANHPLNNYDINDLGEPPLYRYHVYDGVYPGSTRVDTYHWLADAVERCGTNSLWTIVATENDDDVSDSGARNVLIPSNKNIRLTSPDSNTRRTIIQSEPNERHITSNGTLTIDNIILDGANTGGGLRIVGSGSTDASLTINTGATIRNCSGAYRGGGVEIQGIMTMNGGEITDCAATASIDGNAGGGVYLHSGTFTMNGGSITNNRVPGSGGAGGGVYVTCSTQQDGIFRMNGGTISGNFAGSTVHGTDNGQGGGIYAESIISSRVVLVEISNDSVISNNSVGYLGGGISVCYDADLVVNNGTISENTAAAGGGVSVTDNSTFTMRGGIISGNSASGNGGGVHVAETGTLIITGNATSAPRITNNTAGLNGGGIWTYAYSNLQIASNTVFGRAGTATQNTASASSDLYPVQADFIAAFQTRFTSPVGIYTPWGQNYSTVANHPVNNFDINVIQRTVTVYYIDDQTPANPITAPPPISATFKTYIVGDGAPFRLDGTGDWIIPEIGGYIFDDWAIGSPTSRQGNTTVSVQNVEGPLDVYLIYRERPLTTLTVSKQVAGHYALKDKIWEFTVYFANEAGTPLPAGTQFSYTITNMSGAPSPVTGQLTLNSGGSATFNLKHDQQIEINDLSLDTWIRIVETLDTGYEPSFIDSISSSTTVDDHDTGGSSNTVPVFRQMTVARRFSFTNTMEDPDDLGLDANSVRLVGLSMLAGTSGFTYFVSAYLIRRRRRALDWHRVLTGHKE